MLAILNKLFGAKGAEINSVNPKHTYREVSLIYTAENGEKKVRIIKGTILNDFIIDYSKSLDEIRVELQQLLDFWKVSNSEAVKKQLGYFPDANDIGVHQGGSHLDVILKGKGSLGWLRVEDHYASMLN